MSEPGETGQLERLLELSSDLLCVVGFDGHFKHLNPAWERNLGLSTQDLSAKPFLEWIHPDDRDATIAKARQLEREGGELSFEARMMGRDGSYRRLTWRMTVLAGRQEFCVVARETSPTPSTDPRFRIRLGAAPEGIVILGRSHRVSLVNVESERLRRAGRAERNEESVEIPVTRQLAAMSGELEITIGPAGLVEPVAAAPATQSVPATAGDVAAAADDAIVTTDREGNITSWNAGAKALYGYDESEVAGRPESMLIPAEYAAEERRTRDRLLRGEKAPAYETERVRKGGARIDVSVSIFPLRGAAGSIDGLGEIARDMSGRRHAERELSRRAEQLAASNADLQDYAFVIAHDLQEPLHMIENHLRELGDRCRGKLGGETDEMFGFVQDGAAWMKRLIRDLLDYARLQTRHFELKPVDVSALVDQVLVNLGGSVAEHKARVSRGTLPTVQAEPTQLAQVFQNLIGNALKFCAPGKTPEVHVDVERRPREWRFSVRDNGIGIDPDSARRLFRPLQRLHEESEYPGSGMGLAIAKKIVERHDGRIWVESVPGQGSTFQFTLPVPDEDEQ